VFADSETFSGVKALLRGLEAPVPGRRRPPNKWQLRHFYPYPSEAIHYDAVESRGKISVERYQFRGAGGLAHKILRTDSNLQRLGETRTLFRELLRDRESAVGVLLKALLIHDAVRPLPEGGVDNSEDLMTHAFVDSVELKSLAFEDGSDIVKTRWMDHLRAGVHRILHRSHLSDFDRIDGLMNWVPYCVGMHQLAMARRVLHKDENSPIAYDAGHRSSPVRSLARRHLGDATAAIKESLFKNAVESGVPELTRGSAAWWSSPRTFFTTTMFAVGALNANTGYRNFCLRPKLLQTIVHAATDTPLPLDRFSSEILGQQLGIICDRDSAQCFGPIGVDGRHLQTNGEALVARLDDVGLLRAYSDSTLMVGVEA
jgi:hypothetical protein